MTDTPLCAHHADVIPRMAALSHVDEDITRETARTISKQCPECQEEAA